MKWEYQLTVLGLDDPKEAQETLNRLGREGWELVSAFDIERHHGGSKFVLATLKRPAS